MKQFCGGYEEFQCATLGLNVENIMMLYIYDELYDKLKTVVTTSRTLASQK